ncbi:taurine catabolism dioxygenase TauD [Pseudomonas fluorescens]|uniref:L-asparagine oxygenase n=1 Tax=Pseudomonas fluorescens TaxID=294 RepID=A0A5E7C9A7_PSEFL|nr:taurine catabolism dioxygenase TauD [Pseudomonas fluorescens]VVO01170.1 hypothetical protein PS691_02642 [Pseudomonas fluorescens]
MVACTVRAYQLYITELVGTQLINAHFSYAVRSAVAQWRQEITLLEAVQQLSQPTALGLRLLPAIDEVLAERNLTRADLVERVWGAAFIQLKDAFDPVELPETPTVFFPVPMAEGTVMARATAVGCLAAIGLQAVSYGSEENGELFVNLVVMPGEGLFAEKSRKGMKGHTDAVSFPVRGQTDPENPRISPSPDFVCLSGLRNPDDVHTTVMPLTSVLDKLDPGIIAELKTPQYHVRSQKTFRIGMGEILGDELVLEDASLLFDVSGQHWIRYSHNCILMDDEAVAAKEALVAFEAACVASISGTVISPGDILLVNNRIGLHGRSNVGGEPGGNSRWLLRTYGLETGGLAVNQRYQDVSYRLYP